MKKRWINGFLFRRDVGNDWEKLNWEILELQFPNLKIRRETHLLFGLHFSNN